ncbi:hypothetical protein [Streptomyces anulatus]
MSGSARIATKVADLVHYSVDVAPDTINSTLDDFREAGIAVSGEAPAPQ